ncbi:sigma-54-dependent transcriptional regulator [Niabella drilacis]|uniref:DNA-binding transcriptional response regulator, NtrC family, contains REC, AAA-type ATPase, and a Fis-type DNA-binding domains n=1 Tax=Niabella drilacis (strain DSM 25811 / CCM 8410 / CCUG 62505 / LMG 26954 / E90) TaxID=1285928 RepID=A0A1G7AHC0_NIADE|nr:sigma-54 dependent transcriptional regulator [Niabella drilacis]SDE14221.1 DNA-binding transcriptional response regulator, NtrC family, contains REC, AAA-type ATPase, and a Fis-type DNA-binding domains [Niabella drilacis]
MVLRDASILIVDDDPDVLTAARLLLKSQVKEVFTEKNPENLRSVFSKKDFDLVLMDMNFNSSINTGNEGLYWLRKIRELGSKASIIMITAYGDIDLAVRSLKEGASDFMLKPWQNDQLIQNIKELLKKRTGRPAVPATAKDAGGLLGHSEAMQDVLKKIEKIAPTDANILVLGENGTGKDLVAQAIHQQSLRVQRPFIKTDVGSLTESLFESELFGHTKGAFTDAREERAGRFEAASSGTLFLDEIGNITLHQQARLLTVLQNRQVTKLGSHQPIPIDIRLICATNVPLEELANEKRFRKDLIYRINTVEIILPPLRKRTGDIELLARHFVKQYKEKYFKPNLELDKRTIDKLNHYHFPGNVRELQYAIERAVIMSDGEQLLPGDIVFSPIESREVELAKAPESINLNTLERNAILLAIEKNNGNITKAAKELGLTRTALYRRLNKYDIE